MWVESAATTLTSIKAKNENESVENIHEQHTNAISTICSLKINGVEIFVFPCHEEYFWEFIWRMGKFNCDAERGGKFWIILCGGLLRAYVGFKEFFSFKNFTISFVNFSK